MNKHVITCACTLTDNGNALQEDFSLIKKVILEELGDDAFETCFSEVQEAAVGAASTGQAHVARLITGEEVVLKVQYPNASRIFNADMECLKQLVSMAVPDALPAFNEFGKHLQMELDYQSEKRNLQQVYGAVMSEDKYQDGVVVPKVHEKLCTKKVSLYTR
jgi:aarF domain-containing kinase